MQRISAVSVTLWGLPYSFTFWTMGENKRASEMPNRQVANIYISLRKGLQDLLTNRNRTIYQTHSEVRRWEHHKIGMLLCKWYWGIAHRQQKQEWNDVLGESRI